MPRPLSPEHRATAVDLVRGTIDAETAAARLQVSRRAAQRLRGRYLRSKLPVVDGTAAAPVERPVIVRRDDWGVAHIEAESVTDAYAALGFAMGQDRLWQLDHLRRLAHGRLSEILGAGCLRQDRMHRTIGLTAAAQAAAAAMPAEVRRVLEAMAAGIDAAREAAADNLAVEFDLLEYEPEPWTPVDSIAIWKWRWWMLTGRLDVLAQREAIRRHLSPALAELFLRVEAGDETIVPGREPAAAGGFDTGEGSNNWVVGGSRCAGGAPILATDPHNGVDLSRQWYQAQITCPGIDAIGAFFLGTPGIYLGHTRHTAWGVTNHTASARDLYVETLSPGDAVRYREADGWHPFEVETQQIPVRDGASDTLEIRRTARGPVVSEFVAAIGATPAPVLSLRWVGAEATTGFESMLALIRSRSVDDVLSALRQWPFPILNFLFAGAEGRIGYHVVGRVPQRRRTTYGFKDAGDERDAWTEMHGFDELPHLVDPDRDWLASANNPPWGGSGPYLRSGNWADGYRARRIRARIEALDRHTIDTVGAIHADAVHGRGQALAPAVARIALAQPDRNIRALGEILRTWDGDHAVDSVAPTVFTAFWEQWLTRVTRARFPEEAVSLVASKAGAVASAALSGEEAGWFEPGVVVEAEVVRALGDTLNWLRERLGRRRSQWRWGRLHTVRFRHPASATAALAKLLDVGPFETSGGTGTVRAAGASASRPFEVTGLSTYRMVVDLAAPARALATAAGGQSGHPASPNYRRQSQLWVRDEYHPLLMDRQDVEAHLQGTLALRPR